MASTRPGHRASRSFNVIRTSVAVLPMAPPYSPAMDSNRMHDFSPKVRVCKRVNSASVLSHKDPGFESREPTSPKVSCIGQIKMKPQWVKEKAAAAAAAKPAKNANNSNNKFSKLKKFMFGKRHGKKIGDNNTGVEEPEAKPKEEVRSSEGFPSLGKIKRYSSARYDHKFGDLFVEDEGIIGKDDEEIASAINAW
ncbi:hypothetical protein SUGI_1004570 [Cryptomeria japonica]|uniref:uncharacterized protein At1g76070 n=1 Tax=Cryptomeria japonica TaxID=3369 RepID=UPI0024146E8A|nr:uncharacterized protein At1g76070 [Cryptomeria japonica]GLJ47570.1 hypothetical protein SUGI_1004570 [Cryptomeria japonica]